jgi:hypothetical protein
MDYELLTASKLIDDDFKVRFNYTSSAVTLYSASDVVFLCNFTKFIYASVAQRSGNGFV